MCDLLDILVSLGLKVAQAIGSQNRVFVGKFRPDSDSHFVTVGVKHVKFWTIAGTQLLWQRGKIPKHLQTQMQTMLSVAFAPVRYVMQNLQSYPMLSKVNPTCKFYRAT